MAGRVIVVGSVNVDLVVTARALPKAGETVAGGTFARHGGGKGANQAVAARRLCANVEFVGAVGRDAFGDAARAALEGDGVGTGELRTVDDHPTGIALILVDASGENMIAVAPGANAAVGPADVAAALGRLELAVEDVVLVSHEIPTASAREALVQARRVGARSILNPAPASGLDSGTFGLADLLTPNGAELALLATDEARRTGRPGAPAEAPERQARTLLQPSSEGDGPRVAIVVTLAARGALIVRRDALATPQLVEAPPTRAVDSTGAGDTFNGALAAGLVEGRDLRDAVRRATLAAALATTVVGAREGMPTAAAIGE